MISVYLAAPWAHKPEALAAQNALEASGITVTSHWIKYHPDVEVGEEGYETMLQEQAEADIDDLHAADVFVILNLGKSEGKATELGVAVVLGMPIFLVGSREGNIFYHLPEVDQFDTLDAAIRELKEVEYLMNVPYEADECDCANCR